MMRIYDTFMIRDELDMLECRLTEISEFVDWFVVVEGTVDHQGHPKELVLGPQLSSARWKPWAEKIRYVLADRLPGGPDPWSREHAQREYCWAGIWDAGPGDLILHGDLDEIPATFPLAQVRSARTDGGLVFQQRQHMWAVDWLRPEPPAWGTVVFPRHLVQGFQWMRAQRLELPALPGGGWHFCTLGGPEAILRKLASFCHLEALELTQRGVAEGAFYERGYMPGDPPRTPYDVKLEPVEVDQSWPRWIYERKCPESWFRPPIT